MDLGQLWSILWRRKWIILLTMHMALFIAILVTLLMPPRYTATATLRVATTQIGPVLDQRGYDMSYSDRVMNTYSKLATSGPILSELEQKLGSNKPPTVSVAIPANTELMQFSVEDSDPGRAANAANLLGQIIINDFNSHAEQTGKTADQVLSDAIAKNQSDLDQAQKNYNAAVARNPQNLDQINAARTELDNLQQARNNLLSQQQQSALLQASQANVISVADPAIPPLFPSKPNIPLNIGLGLALGLIGGLGLGFLFEHRDTTLFTTEQIVQATQAQPVGWVPSMGRYKGVLFREHSPEAEAIQRLRTNIMVQDNSGAPCTVLVTSAESGEGKSTIAVNLARSLAQSGRGIVLVDADMRMPVMHRVFGVPNTQGLSSILERKAPVNDVMFYKRNPGVWVIPSGPMPGNPTDLLGSADMAVLLKQLVERFDAVIIDTPPFLPVADTAVLAPKVDQVLLVAGRNVGHRDALQAAYDQLENLHVRSLGVVVNRAERRQRYGYYNYRPVKENRQVEEHRLAPR